MGIVKSVDNDVNPLLNGSGVHSIRVLVHDEEEVHEITSDSVNICWKMCVGKRSEEVYEKAPQLAIISLDGA